MTSATNSITIKFHTDGFGSEPGFMANYITMDAKTGIFSLYNFSCAQNRL